MTEQISKQVRIAENPRSQMTLQNERGSERYSTLKETVKYAAFGLALLVIVGIIAPPIFSGVETSLSGIMVQ